jgi:hypothetical protein
MNALLVSFFAEFDEPKYCGPKAEALKEACRAFSVKCAIQELPSQGYMKNCLRKPQYILDQFDSTDRSVLWVDADSSILDDPALLEQFPCDAVAMTGKHWPVLASHYYSIGQKELAFFCRSGLGSVIRFWFLGV